MDDYVNDFDDDDDGDTAEEKHHGRQDRMLCYYINDYVKGG